MRQWVMIEVERVNGQRMFVNPDLIKFIEITPDTVITFVDGEKILLRTKPDEIVKKIVHFRKKIGMPTVKD